MAVYAFLCFNVFHSAGRFHGSLKNNPAKILAATPTTDDSESPQLCDLCDEPIDIKFLPCGHVVICKLCAKRATKCLACQVHTMS